MTLTKVVDEKSFIRVAENTWSFRQLNEYFMDKSRVMGVNIVQNQNEPPNRSGEI